METVPQYVIGPKRSRYVIPEILLDFLLLIIFTALIIIVLNQLKIRLDLTIYLIISAIIIIILAIDIIVSCINAANIKYNFYIDRIEVTDKHKTVIILKDVKKYYSIKGVFDHLFKTDTIIFDPKFKLLGIENMQQLMPYIGGLVQNAHYNYQQQAQNITGQQAAQNYMVNK